MILNIYRKKAKAAPVRPRRLEPIWIAPAALVCEELDVGPLLVNEVMLLTAPWVGDGVVLAPEEPDAEPDPDEEAEPAPEDEADPVDMRVLLVLVDSVPEGPRPAAYEG